jgi:hypothetical protein
MSSVSQDTSQDEQLARELQRQELENGFYFLSHYILFQRNFSCTESVSSTFSLEKFVWPLCS